MVKVYRYRIILNHKHANIPNSNQLKRDSAAVFHVGACPIHLSDGSMNLKFIHDLGFDIYSKKRVFYSFCLYLYYTVILSAILFYLLGVHMTGMPLESVIHSVATIVLIKFFVFHFFNIRRISLTKSVNTYVLVKTFIMSVTSGLVLIILSRLGFLISDIPSEVFVLDAILTWAGLNAFYFVFSELFNLGKSKFTVITRNYKECGAPDNRTLIVGTDHLSQSLYKLISQSEYCSNTIVIWPNLC